jgi:hypothetical protein
LIHGADWRRIAENDEAFLIALVIDAGSRLGPRYSMNQHNAGQDHSAAKSTVDHSRS